MYLRFWVDGGGIGVAEMGIGVTGTGFGVTGIGFGITERRFGVTGRRFGVAGKPGYFLHLILGGWRAFKWIIIWER